MVLPQTLKLRDGRSSSLRSAKPDDAKAWVDHVNRVGSEGVYLMTEHFTRKLEELQRQFLGSDSSSALWLVAEIDGSLVAAADIQRGQFKKNAHTASLGMSVEKQFRGAGLGTAILKVLLDWARENQVRKVKLGVFSTNERAIRLYQRFGFSEEGRLRNDIILDGKPADLIQMALWL